MARAIRRRQPPGVEDLRYAPIAHDVQPVVQVSQKVQPMLCDHDRLPHGLQIDQDPAELLDTARIQARGRLVEEHGLRVAHQRGSDGHPLLLSAGQLAQALARRVRNAHAGKRLGHPCAQLLPGHAQILPDKRHLVLCLASEELVCRVLEHVTHHPGQLSSGVRAHIGARQRDAAVQHALVMIGGKAVQHPRERRFPAAGVAREHDQLAALDDKPHVSQRGHIVAVVCERPDVRFDHAHTATPRSTSPTATATPSTGLKDRSR